MKNLIILFFVIVSMSGCITTDKKNLKFSQNMIKNHVNGYKFIEWKCYKSHWLYKYRELALTVGFFPEFQNFDQYNKIGMILFHNKNFKKLAIHTRKGVQNYWDWGGKNFNNYQIIIHPSGNAWFFNFQDTKPNEQKSPQETYDCKSSQINSLNINYMSDILNELLNVPNFRIQDFRNILQIHMLKCLKLNFPSTNTLKIYPKVNLQFFLNKDGNVNKVNFLDRARYENDRQYKFVADIAIKAGMNCKHLPIPKTKIELFKNFIIDFDPNFILTR